MALLSSTLFAWYSVHGLSILSIASLSLLGLPYIIRVLWSPLLDRYFISVIGKRRGWLLLTQFSLFIGFISLGWFSPANSPKFIALLALFLSFISATQDTVIDAHRTEYLEERWHGLGASLAVTAYRLALLLSGGFALLIAQYWGWPQMFFCMGVAMVPPMIASWISMEPYHPQSSSLGLGQTFVQPFQELCQRPYFGVLIAFILLFKLGEAFTSTTSGIVMPFLIQGLGFSLETIAYVNKLIGILAIVGGGLLAGILLLYWSLFRALLYFGILQALTNVLFVMLVMFGANIPLFVVAVIADNLAAGMGTTALVALLMHLVDKRYTATQFSLLVAVSSLPRVFSGPVAGWLQAKMGWLGLYQLSVILALLFLPFLYQLGREIPIGSFRNGYKIFDKKSFTKL